MDRVVVAHISGKIEAFTPVRYVPFSCEAFVSSHNDNINLKEILVDAIDIEVNEPGKESVYEERDQIPMPINFRQRLSIYALVEGGWLPPPFVNPSVYLFDRNVIGRIHQIPREILVTYTKTLSGGWD